MVGIKDGGLGGGHIMIRTLWGWAWVPRSAGLGVGVRTLGGGHGYLGVQGVESLRGGGGRGVVFLGAI